MEERDQAQDPEREVNQEDVEGHSFAEGQVEEGEVEGHSWAEGQVEEGQAQES